MRSRLWQNTTLKILIAGVGNLLRGDDGFGVRVAQRLEKMHLPEGVRVVEVGISGMSLVQELIGRYDACIVLDAVNRDGVPGTLYLLEPVIDFPEGDEAERLHEQLVDMHYAEPSQALRLAGALGVRPKNLYVLACQPADVDDFKEDLSPSVERAVGKAVEMARDLIARLLRTDTARA